MNTDNLLPYPENMILLVEVGSTAHGTGLSGKEDHNETAVVIESASRVVGLRGELKNMMERTQSHGRSVPGDVDRRIYSLRHFLSLCVAGNPSIQLVLYAPVHEATPLGYELRDLAPCFIGRHIIPRYRGYMKGQVMRMMGLKAREELISAYGYDVKYAMHAARLGFQCIELITQGEIRLPIEDEPGEWLRSLRRGEVPYEEWLDRVNGLDNILELMEKDTGYPLGPQTNIIEKWSIKAHRDFWNSTHW